MADRSLLVDGGRRLTLAIAASLLAVACGGGAPAPSPEAPPVTTLAPAPTLPPETVPTLPPMGGGAPAGFPPAGAAPPVAAESPAASPAGPPSPSAADEANKQREDQLRADIAAAKGRADTLAAQVASECPELKPGEMRHPGAVGRCNQLKAEANQAASQYETLKQQARSVGIAVQ
jgi:hypothetical protein